MTYIIIAIAFGIATYVTGKEESRRNLMTFEEWWATEDFNDEYAAAKAAWDAARQYAIS